MNIKRSRQARNEIRQAFLLSFFDNKEVKYEVLEVNGFMLVKHVAYDDPNKPAVDLYSKETFAEFKVRAKIERR